MQAGPPRWLFGLPVQELSSQLRPGMREGTVAHHRLVGRPAQVAIGARHAGRRRGPQRRWCVRAQPGDAPQLQQRRAPRQHLGEKIVRVLVLRPGEASEYCSAVARTRSSGSCAAMRPDAAALAGAGEDDDQMTANTRVRLFAAVPRRSRANALVVPQAQRPGRPDALGRLSCDQQRLQRSASRRSTSLKLGVLQRGRPLTLTLTHLAASRESGASPNPLPQAGCGQRQS